MKTYYIYSDGQLWEVDHEIYKAINELNNSAYYRARKLGECFANRRERALGCDGDCPGCKYYAPKKLLLQPELDLPIDGFEDPQILYRCEEILADMGQTDARLELAGRMIMETYNQHAISGALGVPVSTYRDMLRRVSKKLKEE